MSSSASVSVSVSEGFILRELHQHIVSHIISMMRLLGRIVAAADYVSPPSIPNEATRCRISKSAAVLVGFYIFHSFPNYFLLTKHGRRMYSYYGQMNSNSIPTRLIEIFLCGGFLVHAVLATRKVLSRGYKPAIRNPLLVSGMVIGGLVSMHLLDFRFKHHVLSTRLDDQVFHLLNARRSKYTLYWIFVLGVCFHVLKGMSRAWIRRLGFKGEGEVERIYRLSKFLVLIATGLYAIPLMMKTPYEKDDTPSSPLASNDMFIRQN
jgi:succinate dehydrogenase/fumarate reductase cytochrome b subunit